MTPQEKAKRLVVEMLDTHGESVSWKRARKRALFVVNEIVPIVEGYEDALDAGQRSDLLEYWLEVKREIEEMQKR